jgi:hypothetical protein
MTGTASLSTGRATTNGSGFATITAQLTNQNGDVQVSACVAPNNVPCQIFTLFSTPSSLWTLETVSESSQAVPTGQVFQPLVMRVADGSLAANPVMGVTVTFETTLARGSTSQQGPPGGETLGARNELPVILGSSQAQVVTNQDGLASIVPSVTVPSVGSVGPWRCVHRGKCGPLDGVFANGGRGSDSSGAAKKHSHECPRRATRSVLCSEFWIANADVRATKCDRGAIRCSGGRSKQRAGGFARERLPGIIRGRCFQWGRLAAESRRERELFSAMYEIEAGRSQVS